MKKQSIKGVLIALGTAFAVTQIALYATGCGGAHIRSVNVAEGEYHTEAEVDAMSNRAKNQYCSALRAEMTASQGELDRVNREIQDTQDLIKSIRRQISPIEREVLRLESDIRSLEDNIAEVKALPKTWKIRPGESLTIIAMQKNIYNDIDKWWRLFDANRSKIDDPYYIFPDTVLVIPRDWPLEGKPKIPEDLIPFIVTEYQF